MKKTAKQRVRKRKNRMIFAYLLGNEIKKGYKKISESTFLFYSKSISTMYKETAVTFKNSSY